MIYVVIKEVGEYSDYSKRLMFASISKDSAELKCTALAEAQKPVMAASEEFKVKIKDWDLKNKRPNVNYGAPEFAPTMNAFYEMQDAFQVQTKAELALKYKVLADEIEYGTYCYEGTFSIEEVESDEHEA